MGCCQSDAAVGLSQALICKARRAVLRRNRLHPMIFDGLMRSTYVRCFCACLPQSLSRTESCKLFYQVLVTTSTGFIQADQAAPYADITIRAGARFM